jgi:hypothetical protein
MYDCVTDNALRLLFFEIPLPCLHSCTGTVHLCLVMWTTLRSSVFVVV